MQGVEQTGDTALILKPSLSQQIPSPVFNAGSIDVWITSLSCQPMHHGHLYQVPELYRCSFFYLQVLKVHTDLSIKSDLEISTQPNTTSLLTMNITGSRDYFDKQRDMDCVDADKCFAMSLQGWQTKMTPERGFFKDTHFLLFPRIMKYSTSNLCFVLQCHLRTIHGAENHHVRDLEQDYPCPVICCNVFHAFLIFCGG